MNTEECLEQGLLKKTAPDAAKARASLEMAEHKLGLAEKEFEYGIHENAVTSAYASMFHSARALLFKDGYKERSHYAVYVYLNEKYAGRLEKRYANELNSLRLHRHDLMYSLENSAVGESEAKEAISTARGFLDSVGKIV